MKEIRSKSALAVLISKFSGFENPKVKDEQYETDSEIAAEVLWNTYMRDNIVDRVIADLGSGTGILSIGAAILGAKKVYMVERDAEAIKIAKKNIELADSYMQVSDRIKIIHSDISEFNNKVDLVIENPPFGTREKHADKKFLEKAFNIADKVVSFHKYSTKIFVEKIAKDHEFKVVEEYRFEFPIKNKYTHHTKKIQRIDVGCWEMEKRQSHRVIDGNKTEE